MCDNPTMHIVAITQLGGPVEAEAVALALDLDSAPYDERLNLNVGLPVIVLGTPDEARARRVHAQIQQRGHQALVVNGADVVPSTRMISLRRFGLDERAVLATDKPGESLPYDEITTLVRATSDQVTETTEVFKEKKFDMGRALVTGGLVISKTTTQKVTTSHHKTDDVLYLFRRGGGKPWFLRASGTHYTPLGEALAPTARANFLGLIELLRRRAPRAIYSESLVALRKVPERARRAAAGIHALSSSPEGGTDLLAHILALSSV